MMKWAIALDEFDISYQPKPAKKGQAVADFIADFTYPVDIVSTPKKVVLLPLEAQKIEPIAPTWSLYVDGLSNHQGCGARLVLTTLDKVAMKYAFRFKFKASNNEVEYEALIAGLYLAKHFGSPTTLTLRIAPWQHIWHKHNCCSSTSTTRSPKFLKRQTVMQMFWLASPQRWKARLGEKFRSNCWQHQAPWLQKCATYNKGIVDSIQGPS
ncbi:hypothetical protein ACFX1Q_030439 [Malus domestica]